MKDTSLTMKNIADKAGGALTDAVVAALAKLPDGEYPREAIAAVVELVSEAYPLVRLWAKGRDTLVAAIEREVTSRLRGPAVGKIVQAEADRIVREIAKEEIDRREESLRALVATMVAAELAESGKRIVAEAAAECVERIRRKLLAGA